MALRPRVTVVGGPHEAHVAHKARTRGRRPRVSTRVHVGARVGATWQVRATDELTEIRYKIE